MADGEPIFRKTSTMILNMLLFVCFPLFLIIKLFLHKGQVDLVRELALLYGPLYGREIDPMREVRLLYT